MERLPGPFTLILTLELRRLQTLLHLLIQGVRDKAKTSEFPGVRLSQKSTFLYHVFQRPRGSPRALRRLSHIQVRAPVTGRSFVLLTCPRQMTAGQSLAGQGSFWFQGLASPALGKEDRSDFCASSPTPHPALNSRWLPTAPNRNSQSWLQLESPGEL